MSTAVSIRGHEEGETHTTVVATQAPKPGSGSILNFSRRIPELDGYRGMAVAVALLYHYLRFAIVARPPQLLGYVYTSTPLLWAGMEMFFVLSGFLIGGILLDARESPRYYSTFYIRRFCRILPIYFLFLTLVALAYHFVYRPVGAPLDWGFAGRLPWPSYFLFTQNFVSAKVDWLGPPILAITWSLAVEEQFYLALPLIIRNVRKEALPYIFVAGIIAAPIIRMHLIHESQYNLWATYVLLPCRMDSLLIGALCAYCVRLPGAIEWLQKHRDSVWLLFFGLIAGMPVISNAAIPFTPLWLTVGIGWMSVFFATMLLLGVIARQSLLSRAMRISWLQSFGTIGYSVYLFHLAIYIFCMWLLTNHGWELASWRDLGVTLIAVGITIAVGKLSWRYFEKPIVRWSHRWEY